MTARISLAASLILLLAACASPPMKITGHLDQPAAPTGEIPPPVQLSPILPKPKPTQRPETYSVVVNNVRASELLFALARDAKLNVDINSGIVGSVTLNAIDQTLPQLLTRIARQIDMRWELDGPNLAVMPDTPYLRIYRIDYVNMERTTTGTSAISTTITTAGSGSGGGSGTSGNTSGTAIRNSSENKFWATLIANLKEILRETDKILPGGAQITGAPAAAPAASAAPGQPTPAAAAAAPASGPTFIEAGVVISNPEAGVITIRATSRQHAKVQEFLDEVMVSAKRQVLIEATIVEVTLNNLYQQGIDWSLLRRGPSGISITQAVSGATQVGPLASLFVGGITDPNFRLGNISATVRLLESFGNVRVLSSPKISVLNNQSAALKVVNNRVYFTIKADTSATANVSTTTYTSTLNTVAEGVVMNVTPQISENDSIILNVKPSVTRILRYVNDPNPALANPCGNSLNPGCNIAPVQSPVPEMQTREMESLIKVNSGQIAVMGGLIQDQNTDVEDGVPGLNRTSIGALFTHQNKANVKTELVIFMRPLVIKDPSIDGDYRAFRPLLPDEQFLARPNPGKPAGQGRPASQ